MSCDRWRLSDVKRAKLIELTRFRHGLPYASQTALAAITGAGHRGELPENYKREDQLLARKAQMLTAGGSAHFSRPCSCIRFHLSHQRRYTL
jgi:hypothetical protein